MILDKLSLSSLVLLIASLFLLVPFDKAFRVLNLLGFPRGLAFNLHDLLMSHVLSLLSHIVIPSSSFDDSLVSEVECVFERVH